MTPAPGKRFVTEIAVRFADCDPAGIVFYPRYFEMFNAVVEDWCGGGLGIGFRELHLEQGLGLPAVHIETDFVAPSELGETLRAELSVQKLGNASITVLIRLLGPLGEERVQGTLVLAVMDLRRRRAVAIPEAMRDRIVSFCGAGNE